MHVHRPDPDRGLSRFQRITKSSIFHEAFDKGPSYVGKFMVMRLRCGEQACLRLGVIASKRSFRKAVMRVKAKRLLKEAYRLNRFRLHGDYDVILIARQHILDASLRTIEKELLTLAEKAGLLDVG